MQNRTVIGLLAAGQFVMVLDSSVMNVSISRLVEDLDTTVPSIQLAITAYTLVMAALMLTGGKIGDLLGSRRTFVIGLGIYGFGSLLTSVAPNIGVLLLGWSVIEGLGAVLVIPSIAALTAANYQGKERGLAYGVLGGVAAAGIAIGPLIGGWVTTNLSWRYVFVAETVIVVAIIVAARRIADAPRSSERPRLDVVGAVLSALGVGLVVFGILRSSQWGWVTPRNPPRVAGRDLAPFGFSIVMTLLIVGAAVLAALVSWERRVEARGGVPLVRLALLGRPRLRAGLLTLLMQQLVLAGTFFVLPLYLQVVLGLDAFRSGTTIFPLSLTMFLAALGGPLVLSAVAPRRIVRIGLVVIAIAELALQLSLDHELRRVAMSLSLALLGLGVGLIASQLGNVIMSTADADSTSETGGLQGTATNLGSSLGTALIGALLLTGLAGAFQGQVASRPEIPEPVRAEIATATADGLDFVPVATVERVASAAGLPEDQVSAITDAYREGQLEALRAALGAVILFVLAGLTMTRSLPDRPLTASGAAPS
jgi:EmrB/QacA subfamily drug resistance transporter